MRDTQKPVTDNNRELVNQIMRYADDHYTEGWDTIVECWEPEDIAGALINNTEVGEGKPERDCTTLEEVLQHSVLASVVSVYKDRWADARNSAF